MLKVKERKTDISDLNVNNKLSKNLKKANSLTMKFPKYSLNHVIQAPRPLPQNIIQTLSKIFLFLKKSLLKLLQNINETNATGPDNFKVIFLKYVLLNIMKYLQYYFKTL